MRQKITIYTAFDKECLTMSKFFNYLKCLKDSRYDILTAMMSANATMGGTVSDWKLMADYQEQR